MKDKHVKSRKTATKVPWTVEEMTAVQKHRGQFIRLANCPGKSDCMKAKDDKRLQNRDWKAIKFYIKNQISIKQRSLKKK